MAEVMRIPRYEVMSREEWADPDNLGYLLLQRFVEWWLARHPQETWDTIDIYKLCDIFHHVEFVDEEPAENGCRIVFYEVEFGDEEPTHAG